MRHTPCGYRVRPPSQSRLTPCQLPHRGSQDQPRPVIARRAKPDVAIRNPRPPCLPLRGRCPAGAERAVPRLANSDTICYNTPKRCSGGGWPLLSREEAMLLKASSYPVARR